MRNPDRLYTFYNELRRIHQDNFPDWRFGQLMCNFFGWLISEKGMDAFFPEEQQMIGYLKEFAGEATNEEI